MPRLLIDRFLNRHDLVDDAPVIHYGAMKKLVSAFYRQNMQTNRTTRLLEEIARHEILGVDRNSRNSQILVQSLTQYKRVIDSYVDKNLKGAQEAQEAQEAHVHTDKEATFLHGRYTGMLLNWDDLHSYSGYDLESKKYILAYIANVRQEARFKEFIPCIQQIYQEFGIYNFIRAFDPKLNKKRKLFTRLLGTQGDLWLSQFAYDMGKEGFHEMIYSANDQILGCSTEALVLMCTHSQFRDFEYRINEYKVMQAFQDQGKDITVETARSFIKKAKNLSADTLGQPHDPEQEIEYRLNIAETEKSRMTVAETEDSRMTVAETEDSRMTVAETEDSRMTVAETEDSRMTVAETEDSRMTVAETEDSRMTVAETEDSRMTDQPVVTISSEPEKDETLVETQRQKTVLLEVSNIEQAVLEVSDTERKKESEGNSDEIQGGATPVRTTVTQDTVKEEEVLSDSSQESLCVKDMLCFYLIIKMCKNTPNDKDFYKKFLNHVTVEVDDHSGDIQAVQHKVRVNFVGHEDKIQGMGGKYIRKWGVFNFIYRILHYFSPEGYPDYYDFSEESSDNIMGLQNIDVVLAQLGTDGVQAMKDVLASLEATSEFHVHMSNIAKRYESDITSSEDVVESAPPVSVAVISEGSFAACESDSAKYRI